MQLLYWCWRSSIKTHPTLTLLHFMALPKANQVLSRRVIRNISADNILPQRWAFPDYTTFQALANITCNHQREFAIYTRLCRPGQQLIVAAADCTKLEIMKVSDHQLQRQSYNDHLHSTFVTKMEFVAIIQSVSLPTNAFGVILMPSSCLLIITFLANALVSNLGFGAFFN